MVVYRLILVAAAALTGCAIAPTGPRVMTLPGTGMSFEQFRFDEGTCRGYAIDSVGGQSPSQVANQSAVGSAVVGTAIGAVAGAALGGRQGSAVGAGVGLIAGSAAGAGHAEASGYGAQQRYDQAFVQCMYAKGHRVPVSARYAAVREPVNNRAAPPFYPPPPPAGYPPPPPLGYSPPPPVR